MLFDGRSLHKWTGNTTNYVPQEGTIYVTASYGGKGNLYTVEEYGDFILRFEFRFLREGVNNGIGLRTPMGVDAAYHGMEIQILDHDAPIYKNLRVYQQHGSVYGIIPAKRIKFGELGTWNVEEIRAVGDRITVTVNGEVILDGDIREACQGHNVSEDGSKKNPYTVDAPQPPGTLQQEGAHRSARTRRRHPVPQPARAGPERRPPDRTGRCPPPAPDDPVREADSARMRRGPQL